VWGIHLIKFDYICDAKITIPMKKSQSMGGLPKASLMKEPAAKKSAGTVVPTCKGATAKLMAGAKKAAMAKKKGY
jgi:hypothetical protein